MGLSLYEANNRNKGVLSLIKDLQELFCLKYKTGFKKRKFLLYNSVHLLTESIVSKPIIEDTDLVKIFLVKLI